MSKLSKLHYVNLGIDGTFKPSGNTSYNTLPEDVDRIFSHLEANQTNNIVLYFHGGLVNAERGMDSAEKFQHMMQDSNIHPISFVWETGPFETISQNIKTIFETKLFQKILEKVLKIGGGMAGFELPGQRGFGKLSTAEIQAELLKDNPFGFYGVDLNSRSALVDNADESTLLDEIEMEMQVALDGDPEVDQRLVDNLTDKETELLELNQVLETQKGSRGIFSVFKLVKSAATITFRVIKRVRQGRDHQVYPTIIEEICREILVADAGVWLWGQMKKKAKNMWLDDPTGTPDTDQHVGNYLLMKLRDYCAVHPNARVDLVGHSAGSIAICEMFRTMASSDLDVRIRHVLFLAPACRCDLFSETIIDNVDRFSTFRMFTMKDQFELDDFCLKVVYPNSLLYLISGILEKDEYDAFILGMQRYHLKNFPYDGEQLLNKIITFLQGNENRSIYSKTDEGALDGLISDSISHSGFNEPDKSTMRSIAYILKKSDER